MHFTPADLNVLPDVIAVVAVIGGYLGVTSTNRSNSRLAREGYRRDRLTETYLDLLRGVHLRNTQLDESYRRPLGKPPRTPTEIDPTTADEALFGARLLAYASPEVDGLWSQFATITTEFDNLLNAARQAHGTAPIDIQTSARHEIECMYDKWKQARDHLQATIRSELRKPLRRRRPARGLHLLLHARRYGRLYSRDALNWRFSQVTQLAGIGYWHAHEARHTAVSIMSDNGAPIQDISDTKGHKSTHVTETV